MESNRIILVIIIVLIIGCVYKYCSKRNANNRLIEKTKFLMIDMYGDKQCPFTMKMTEKLTNNKLINHINYIDVSTPHGINKYEKLKVSGVPVFHSKLTDKIQLGDMSIDELINNLS